MLTNGKDYIERRIEHGLKDIGYVESLYPEYFWEDHHRRHHVLGCSVLVLEASSSRSSGVASSASPVVTNVSSSGT